MTSSLPRPPPSQPSLTQAPESMGNGVEQASGSSGLRVGPHPGFIASSSQYCSEVKLRRMLKDNGCDPSREDSYRLQGVQLMDNVREHLQL